MPTNRYSIDWHTDPAFPEIVPDEHCQEYQTDNRLTFAEARTKIVKHFHDKASDLQEQARQYSKLTEHDIRKQYEDE